MRLKYGEQKKMKDLRGLSIDLFVLAGNHEDRRFTAYDKIIKFNEIEHAIALCYKDDFDSAARDISCLFTNSHEDVISTLNSLIGVEGNQINVVVDYSCMTKSWYYAIVLFFSRKSLSFEQANIFFVYTPSEYCEPLLPKPNTEMAPLPGKYFVPTDKPKALIVCLGYEQSKAEGIIEHLDPKECFLFYTDPAFEQRFVDKVLENNISIFNERKDQVMRFPLNDLLSLERQLTSLYFFLRENYSIIIAPLGPKPFALTAMLLSVQYPDIDIWRVGSGSDINEYNRAPLDDETFIVSLAVFECDKSEES